MPKSKGPSACDWAEIAGNLIQDGKVTSFDQLWQYMPRYTIAEAANISYKRLLRICSKKIRRTEQDTKAIASALHISTDFLNKIIQ